ncbi:UDP-N-acetylglucosamine 2-epimerase (hydrolyzing) [Lachnospiraceae bacterium]|nr:UDP-N-acetylglucosamine 2-epimerase (hydrolyzing) [Lachnospiraceae bacterium]
MKIGIVTTTRAEYGLLKPLIRKINEDFETELNLIVTGTHLLNEYGLTVKYIEEDGFPIASKVFVNICTKDSVAVSQTMGRYFLAFAGVFEKLELDFLIVLGDRYELIPICYCAVNAKVPIAHISGGEITEGAIDDTVRHCVTKLSYLHFPACETYRKRIIQLGEAPNRVFNVGDPGVENVRMMELISEMELRKILNLEEGPYFSVIFHPITLDDMKPEEQIQHLLAALDKFTKIQFVIMKANADSGGQKINDYLETFVESHKNCKLFSSLRIEEFLSLQKYSLGLIGNSSSGIVETPCFGIPTVNIGDRQKGRLFADSIISCNINEHEIIKAINLALTDKFRERARQTINPYGSGQTSAEILRYIKKFVREKSVNLKKTFYDLKDEDI